MWQLPVAPEGLEYRKRRLPEGEYMTTGAFPIGAPNAKQENLRFVGALILDVDLCDWLVHIHDDDAPGEREVWKKWSYVNSAYVIAEELESLHAEVQKFIPGFTYAINSGYGLHYYFWLAAPLTVTEAQEANKALIASVNKSAGWAICDEAVKDVGTRLLRIPGTMNTKGANPVECELFQALPDYRYVVPQTQSLLSIPPEPGMVLDNPGAFGALFAGSQSQAENAVLQLAMECPFFEFALDQPEKLNYECWRGAATNLAAVAGEHGRAEFHSLSQRDERRYEKANTDKIFDDSLASVEEYGPMSYSALQAAGWQGSPPAGVKAPAGLRYSSVQSQAAAEVPGMLLTKEAKPAKSMGNLRKILRTDEQFGARLRYNEMSGSEYDEKPIHPTFGGWVAEYLEDTYGLAFSITTINECVYQACYENKFHPVADYLQGLVWDGKPRAEQVISSILGIKSRPLWEKYFRKFLISAVARALCEDPVGVQVDTVLVLKGGQGVGKSQFFRILSEPWFSDTAIEAGSKDALIAINSCWILEWGEIEYVLSKDRNTKNFITSQIDRYRPPYARENIAFPRRSIIVGTTNSDHFLSDPTGSRRYWVMDAPDDFAMDLKLLRKWKDQLWAEAKAAYDSGELWWLDRDADNERASEAMEYQLETPWEGRISIYCQGETEITISEVLSKGVLKEEKDHKAGDFKQVAAILRKLGFKRVRVRVGGKRAYVFRRSVEEAGDVVINEQVNDTEQSNVSV